MGDKKTTMRRAFIEVGDDRFVPIEQVASDPALRAAAIESLRREIDGLSLAEKRVAKNTLQFLRSVRDERTIRRSFVQAPLAALRRFLAGFAFGGARLVAQARRVFAPRR